ncbi:unnamed protein product [Rodentolepis nana]|uniref:LIM zinc-binding domain-containing protein n=1 Tax=Rodentolepis nana TaxID=102285 RepID=A0A0R3TQN9_RODNA|nr:unnamed protein product [Rodentolepis nana]
MNTRHLDSPFKEHPDLLNIDTEYAVNLKILLEGGPFNSFVQSKTLITNNGRRIDCSSDIDSISSSSPTSSPKDNISISHFECIPVEKAAPVNDLKVIPEEISISDSTSDHHSVIAFEQDSVRAYHSNFFPLKKDLHDTIDVSKTIPASNQVSRSVSLGKRNLSARIQSLLENFESNGQHHNDSSVCTSPESRRSSEKLLNKSGSPDNLFSDPKASAESCLVCNKVVYPLDRFSTGTHVYHKFCLRCNVCDRTLSPANCEYAKDELFCRSHFLDKAHGLRKFRSMFHILTSSRQF